mmetsp:Transcript_4426/g.12389  ORF Transcript_4426/g.12389 Transcript_4426/m.12389 type:complete len:350 (+) Transcript_4426:727-1776(+)
MAHLLPGRIQGDDDSRKSGHRVAVVVLAQGGEQLLHAQHAILHCLRHVPARPAPPFPWGSSSLKLSRPATELWPVEVVEPHAGLLFSSLGQRYQPGRGQLWGKQRRERHRDVKTLLSHPDEDVLKRKVAVLQPTEHPRDGVPAEECCKLAFRDALFPLWLIALARRWERVDPPLHIVTLGPEHKGPEAPLCRRKEGPPGGAGALREGSLQPLPKVTGGGHAVLKGNEGLDPCFPGMQEEAPEGIPDGVNIWQHAVPCFLSEMHVVVIEKADVPVGGVPPLNVCEAMLRQRVSQPLYVPQGLWLVNRHDEDGDHADLHLEGEPGSRGRRWQWRENAGTGFLRGRRDTRDG